MSKVLAVFGATGQQGSSVVNYVSNDPQLSREFKLRAITRDVQSEKARQLASKAEVVQGDVSDPASLEKALIGAHTVFAMTTPDFGPNALEVEFNHGKMIADASVKNGIDYIIFSTLPNVTEISKGKYTKNTPFDAKARAEQYIRGLPIKSAFYSPGFFMENFNGQPFLAPQKGPHGTWTLNRHTSAKTQIPFIDATGDTGKFVGAILDEPAKYEGKTFCAAQGLYSWEEVAAIMSKATGQTIEFKTISEDEFRNSLPFAQDIFAEGFSCQEEFGSYGPDTAELVAWAAANARGKLTTLEEYFQTHPLQL